MCLCGFILYMQQIKSMKKMLIKIALGLLILYLVACVVLYFWQERLIFFPEKLDKAHVFRFEGEYEEEYLEVEKGVRLHGILFKTARERKGLIFYLHGNAGCLNSWGYVTRIYKNLGYDVFILDYRGFGKSEGAIRSQAQLFADNQLFYDKLKARYAEEDIVVLGYSIGSGMAAKLASDNAPKLLILQAPYYNLMDLMRNKFPIAPTFLLRYRFETNEYLKRCAMPVVIFHGREDEVIYYGSAEKLAAEFKAGDRLIPLEGVGHNNMGDYPDYQSALGEIL